MKIRGPGDFLPSDEDEDDGDNPRQFPEDDYFYPEEPEYSHGRETDFVNETHYARE